MADEEVRDQNFREQINTSPPKQACHQNLTFFFRPLPDVDERERLRGRMGRGMAVGQVEDDVMMGRGRNEVSSFLVFAKILVSISKIQLLPSNFCIC
jgi:hypothetical protein